MLLGIDGTMGTGKTLLMSTLASVIAPALGIPIHANYSLVNSEPLNSLKEMWRLGFGILCLDELHVQMDSRLWKNNVALTHFITQTRKKNLLVIYTTQNIRQVDLRVRQNTDILVRCEKTPTGRWYHFIDYQFMRRGRSFFLPYEKEKGLYRLYDTFEVVRPIGYSE